jgi:hypothetical protein
LKGEEVGGEGATITEGGSESDEESERTPASSSTEAFEAISFDFWPFEVVAFDELVD